MTAAWTTVAVLALGTITIRGTGPALLANRELPARLTAVIAFLPAAVLSALVVTDTFGTGGHALTLDARAGGLGAAAVAVALRLPMIVVIVVAAVVTALLRAAT